MGVLPEIFQVSKLAKRKGSRLDVLAVDVAASDAPAVEPKTLNRARLLGGERVKTSDCGATGGPGPGGGGFDHGNVCAVGEANRSEAVRRYRELVERRQRERDRKPRPGDEERERNTEQTPATRERRQEPPAQPQRPAAPPEPPRREISVQEAVDEALGPEPTAEAQATPEPTPEPPAPEPTPAPDPNAPQLSRRERMQQEILQAAKAVQFSDEPYSGGSSGEFDPDELDRDEIDVRLAEQIGFDQQGVRDTVAELIEEHVPPEEQAAARSALHEWDARGLRSEQRWEPVAVAATRQVREALQGVVSSPEFDTALEDLQLEAQEAIAAELGTPSVLYRHDLRDNRLTEWATNNKELFGAGEEPQAQSKYGVWRPHTSYGQSREDYSFKASNGEEFEISAIRSSSTAAAIAERAIGSDAKIRDIVFSNESQGGSFQVTGSAGGSARDVFTNVIPAVVAYVQEKSPDVITFSASKEHGQAAQLRDDSRQRLYTRLTSTVTEAMPDYFAIHTSEDTSDTRYFIIAKREHKEKIMEAAQARDSGIVTLVKSQLYTADWQPWRLRKTLLANRTPAGRLKSSATLERDECGANAPGGGGFQPGNTCAADDGGGTATLERPSRRSRIQEEILAAAEEIDFSDQHSPSEEGEQNGPSEEALFDVERQLTPQEREEMNQHARERAANYRANMEPDLEANIEYDQRHSAPFLWRKAGFSGPLVAARVGQIVQDHVPDQREQDLLLSEIDDWRHFGSYGSGIDAINSLESHLQEEFPGYNGALPFADKLQALREEAQASFARAKEEDRQRQLTIRRADLDASALRFEQRAKREWLANLWDWNPQRFNINRSSQGGEGVWFLDGKFRFSTSNGTKYEIKAEEGRRAGGGLAAEISFRNRDVPGNQFRITGTGGAHEVFSAVVPAVVAYAQHHDADVLTFSANEPSRRRLYDRLVRTVSRVLPDYAAVATGDDYSELSRKYIIYKREHDDAVRTGMGVELETLVKTSAAAGWSKSAFQRVASRWGKSTAAECGANAPGGGGFQPGNTCASGDRKPVIAGLVAQRQRVLDAQRRRDQQLNVRYAMEGRLQRLRSGGGVPTEEDERLLREQVETHYAAERAAIEEAGKLEMMLDDQKQLDTQTGVQSTAWVAAAKQRRDDLEREWIAHEKNYDEQKEVLMAAERAASLAHLDYDEQAFIYNEQMSQLGKVTPEVDQKLEAAREAYQVADRALVDARKELNRLNEARLIAHSGLTLHTAAIHGAKLGRLAENIINGNQKMHAAMSEGMQAAGVQEATLTPSGDIAAGTADRGRVKGYIVQQVSAGMVQKYDHAVQDMQQLRSAATMAHMLADGPDHNARHQLFVDGGTADPGLIRNAGYHNKPSSELHAAFTQHMLDSWAASSTDDNPTSMALQYAVAERFGFAPQVRRSGSEQSQLHGRMLYDNHKGVFDAFVEATYQHTQETLQKHGVEHVTLFRGMRQSAERMTGSEVPERGGVRVSDALHEQNPLSSYASSYEVAENFMGYDKYRSISMVEVPRARIFSLATTGPGCLVESEAVVIGGEPLRGKIAVAHDTFGKQAINDLRKFMDKASEQNPIVGKDSRTEVLESIGLAGE